MKNKITKVKWQSPKRAGWLAQRRELQGIGTYDTVRFGSSDTSTIMGYNKWSSRKKLFWNMLGMYVTEFSSFKMEMGQRYELANKDSFESYTHGDKDGFDDRFCKGEKLRKLQSPKYFLLNDKYKHSFSSLDFILPKKGLCPFTSELIPRDRPVETKFVNYNSYTSFKGQPPLYYQTQVQHQNMMLEADAGYLSVIAGGDFYDCFLLDRDEKMITDIDNALSDFQTRVLQAKAILKLQHEEEAKEYPDYEFIETLQGMIVELEPEPAGYEADLEFVENEMFPETNNLEIQGDYQAQEYIDSYIAANQKENEAKKEKTLARTLIASYMKDFEIMKTPTNKVINRRTFEGRPYFSVK